MTRRNFFKTLTMAIGMIASAKIALPEPKESAVLPVSIGGTESYSLKDHEHGCIMMRTLATIEGPMRPFTIREYNLALKERYKS